MTETPEQIANVVSRLASAWRLIDAEELAKGTLVKHPRCTPLVYAHAFGLLKQGRVDDSVAVLKQALARDPYEVNLAILNALASNYNPKCSADEAASAHMRVGVAFRKVLGPAVRIAPRVRPSGSALRVGMLSADLYRHSVTYFLEPLLANLPRDRVEVVMLSSSRVNDDVTERLRGLAAEWHDLAGLDHDTYAQFGRTLGLDVAIDLSGLTAFHRLRSLAIGIAPVQASYLGYPHACGLDTVSARIADDITDPSSSPNRMGEMVARMSGCFLCYQPPADLPAIRDAKRNGTGVVFGSFGNLAKINRPLVASWGRVLDGVPGSRLVLKNHAFADVKLRKLLPARLKAWGLDATRVDLVEPPAKEADHLDAYNDIDIALDTFPYHGTTTTCEALTMGVPVVTFAGDRHASRVGKSLLAAAGCGQWCGENEDGFVARAIELGNAGARDCAARRTLREQVLSSALCDAKAHALEFAAAIESLVNR
jgi:predicted O-linked N-acetylglucosamine transferase (SPINDLY family)